jgi:ABC-type glycerol-3-phosphate transport system substrate-binding protein
LLGRSIEAVLMGKTTPKQALDQAQERWNLVVNGY